MRNQSPSATLRRSNEERQAILEEFESKVLLGAERLDVAYELGVSLATIYRWKRQNDFKTANIKHANIKCMSIEDSLDLLVNPVIKEKYSALEAVFKLIAWLRWPTSPHIHHAAIATCAITYFARDGNASTLDKLHPNALALFSKHLTVDGLRRMCAGDEANLPNFDIWPIGDQNYDEIDYFADIANFILAYNPDSKDRRNFASLNKAYYAHGQGLFGYRWPMTLETFRRYWAVYGPAAPFFYVRRYHSTQEIVLDPSDDGFNTSVDRLWQNRRATIEYLSLCKTAANMMRERLDKRTTILKNFPVFPASLPAAALKIRSLPLGVDALLNGRNS